MREEHRCLYTAAELRTAKPSKQVARRSEARTNARCMHPWSKALFVATDNNCRTVQVNKFLAYMQSNVPCRAVPSIKAVGAALPRPAAGNTATACFICAISADERGLKDSNIEKFVARRPCAANLNLPLHAGHFGTT
jgi:hypothetical protein